MPKIMGKIRKRYMVSEGELFRIYAEIQQVRCAERRAEFMKDFRKLLYEAQPVHLIIDKNRKGGSDDTIR